VITGNVKRAIAFLDETSTENGFCEFLHKQGNAVSTAHDFLEDARRQRFPPSRAQGDSLNLVRL
jgi:hypothetical protein